MTLARRRLRAWIRLLRLTRGAENQLRDFLRVNYNTTLPRFDVMATLFRAVEPMKMSDLSRMLLVSNGNATAVVDRLKSDGLVNRVPSETDRRVVMVSLTDAGRTQFEVLARAHEIEVDRILANLGEKDLDAMRDLIRRAEGAARDKNG
jgi:DNA-binding MarR family transcriptional regulator